MSQSDKGDLTTTAQYLGVSQVFKHLAFCKECRQKSYDIANHTKSNLDEDLETGL